MEFSNLYDDISSVVEETNSSFDTVCRNRRRNYDEEDDDNNDDEGKFKSKNLKAERKRREKLKSRMLQLRSLVPKITNLNKETIITDAIDYIEELKISVTNLTNKIHEMEVEMAMEESFDIIQLCPQEKMKNWGIELEVEVSRINENKLWMKIIFEKKVGGFTKLMEAMSILGIEVVDISVTTTKGAILITSCIEGKLLVPERVREELLDVIKVM
ncbi:unnamed protein product [Lactuca saligna]|uniref:BHLH domain-containing protein n=1 Tax=Lactuca saligna TaxID=75948 RepID=A0AA35ZI79_LACSI|nr:unnamed protein product [Lactuca saligna]